MAAKKKTVRRRETQLAFEALTIEGSLLAPEWLSRVAQLTAPHQAEADYRVPKGLNLRDELGRYWRMAQAHWNEFAAGRAAASADLQAVSVRFVSGLLRDVFGFATLANSEPVVVSERVYPIGHAALGGRVPVVVAPAAAGLEAASAAFGDGTRKRSAFGLAQEYLNAADGSLWGLASDGLTLRVLRDNASLTRPAWLEADLQRIFTEERYPDFAALWLLLHETRFGRDGQPVTECALEAWRNAGREEGTRAREELRLGVEAALLSLGQGFLDHRDNQALRDALHGGTLSRQEYFRQLLRLVYRLIFLLTAEERGVLHAPEGTAEARRIFSEGYGLRRLREHSLRRRAFDRHSDLWESVLVVFRGLRAGEPLLALPALGGLFTAEQCAALDRSKLENHRFLEAIYRLTWIREYTGLSRVNWRDMGPEELGSVYESLLELVPVLAKEGREFTFANAAESKGNARKTSGSYYTPDSLVQVLLDSALEPVIQRTLAEHPQEQVKALLELTIVDPACGSGHFLLAAARRLAAHVARLEANGTPSAEEYRHALRQVVGRCIFGVDLNPMAVELCKVALWMEALEPGRPLSFLDSHIQQGNALLGTTPELMKGGIPDDAWAPLEGDDKKTASALKKRNKAERDQTLMNLAGKQGEVDQVVAAASSLDAASDADAAALAKKQTEWSALLESVAFQHQKLVADAWCAAFVWPKESPASPLSDTAPTNAVWRQLRDEPASAKKLTVETVQALARQYEFFHWHLGFPRVFKRGGFDVVLGNPPWEQVEVKEEEWFASRHPEIAKAENASVRKKLISKLSVTDPALFAEFKTAHRNVDGSNQLARLSGRFPFCARGRMNSYALFAEHNRALIGKTGRAGFICPSGLVTDDTTKTFFQHLVDTRALAAVYHFENEEKIFTGVHHAFRFLLVCLDASASVNQADLLFFARATNDLRDASRHFTLTAADFRTLNPNTRTCPTFRSRRDAKLNLEIYRRVGVLLDEEAGEQGNPWGLRFSQGLFNMASDSHLFRSREALERAGATLVQNEFTKGSEVFLPLVEAKMLHHFDHRFGTYEGQTLAQDNQGKLPELDDAAHSDALRRTLPFYWVNADEVQKQLAGVWERGWLLGWRDITGTEKRRTVVCSLIPRAAVGDKFLLMFPSVDPTSIGCLYACLASFCLDYAARQKVGGTSLKYFTMRQMPVLAPSAFEQHAPWAPSVVLKNWIWPRVLELTFTAWDLQPFATDVGYDGPPFRWMGPRRELLRCELDAAFFHLYGVSRDDTEYVMDTFPVVRRNDEKAHGEYRTKRVILEIYDEMAEAIRTGKPYQTRLDPPPADPRVAHPARGKKPAA